MMAVAPGDVAQRYFECIRSRDIDGLVRLYAEDATFTLPDGRQFAGASAIRQMHAGVFAATAPVPTPLDMIVGDRAVAVEIEAQLPDGSSRRTANFYHLNSDGKIDRLNVYMRGG
jgi:ketosteroid isomerase-like protein